tara:strand:- start:510 stop:1028 length:519 start_codon:yes stop_codon:yes gene_type:complete
MKYKSFINKLKKRLGTEDLDITTDEFGANGRREWLVYEDTVARWHVEPSDWRDPESELVVSSFHTKGVGQESDPHTDYFPGTYWSNATQLIDRLVPPPPKFTPGVLVRGKLENKRAKRHGYAGKTALVTGASGKYMSLQFVSSEDDEWLSNTHTNSWNTLTYPVRDFELVSG